MAITRKKIDIKKVENVSNRIGKSLAIISLEMGHDKSFLRNMIRDSEKLDGNCSMATSDIILFKMLYGEDIESETKKEKAKLGEGKIELPKMSENDLYKVIYCAVYEAVKNAWENAPSIYYEENESNGENVKRRDSKA